jgi:ribose transport system permease protein
MGQMLALLTGGFDLSVGKIVAITSVITALTMAPLHAAHPDATAITLTLGSLPASAPDLCRRRQR